MTWPLAWHPISPAEAALVERVEARFVLLAQRPPETPGWPDPWSGDTDAPSEAFDRVTLPERYAVLDRRVEAWVDVLMAGDLARVAAVAPVDAWIEREKGVGPAHVAPDEHEVRLLRPTRTGATPLLLMTPLRGAGYGGSIAPVVGAGFPAVPVSSDDCFCDACDPGSAQLVSWYDSQVLEVVTGSFCWVGPPGVDVRRGREENSTHVWGHAALNGPARWTKTDTERALAEAYAGRSPHPCVVADVGWLPDVRA